MLGKEEGMGIEGYRKVRVGRDELLASASYRDCGLK
jgi:hypothetical protein